jgi:hypothetical protein
MNHAGHEPGALPGRFQWPRFDFRSDGQIDREIDEEITFHLDSLAREFAAEGASPAESRAMAVERFGDVDAIRAQCRRIALEDRIMLQKINLVVMLIVLMAVIGVSLYVVVTQKHNTLALQAITAEITNMKFEAEGASRDRAAIAEQSAQAAREQAQQERDRAEAVTAFLQSVLAGSDPANADRIGALDLLLEAERSIPTTFADQPELAAKLRQAIANARERAMVDPDGGGRITITSNVSGPVSFDLPNDREFTLRELVSKEPPREGTKAVTTLYRGSGERRGMVTVLRSLPDGTIEGTDAALHSGDHIDIKVESPTAAVNASEARVLIEGDVEKPGWYPISVDGQGTTVRDLLRDASVEKDRWVLYKRNGMTIPPTYRPATSYLDSTGYQFILKPGDELVVRDSSAIPDEQKRRYYIGALSPSQWRQVDEVGQPVQSGCVIRFRHAKTVVTLCNGTLECGSLNERIALSEEFLLFTNREPPLTAIWNVEDDQLVIQWGDRNPLAGLTGEMRFARVAEQPVAARALLPGDWSEIDDTGTMIEAGASLRVLPADDITSLNGVPHGTLQLRLPAQSIVKVQLEFDVIHQATNLTYRFLTGGEDQKRLYKGRWIMEDGSLVLNLPEAPESIGPLIVRLARKPDSLRE